MNTAPITCQIGVPEIAVTGTSPLILSGYRRAS
jgi:hypothetical protein